MNQDKKNCVLAALALFALACMTACAQADQDGDAEDTAAEEAEDLADELGCPGFDPETVPAKYRGQKPCLEQLRWELEWTAKTAMEMRGEGIYSQHDRNTVLNASGTQLYWAWEEDGKRAGNYSFYGPGNTIDEMVLQRGGTATHTGTGVLENDEARITSETRLQGPADGTEVVAIDHDREGRICVDLQFGASMRGTSVTHVPGRGDEEAGIGPGSSRPSWIGGNNDDGRWNFSKEAVSHLVCTGTPKNDYERLKNWYGLQIDENAGTWTFQGTRDRSFGTQSGSNLWQLTLRMHKQRRMVDAPRSAD